MRTRSHYAAILVLLRERGPAGVLSSELYDAPHLYGRPPRNRISEMRADGHLIQTVPISSSVVRYILTQENPSPSPRSFPPRKAEQTRLSQSDDWYIRQTGKPRATVMAEKSTTDDLPLFQGVRS